ncbi:MAG: hypothetical protein AAF790_06970 [Planctomycetota bacterium]
MIYIVAVILSLMFCVMSWSSEIVSGNISHVKNGRQPHAGAAVFPHVPVIPLSFCGVAWILQLLFRSNAIWILAALFAILGVIWTVSFLRLRAVFRQVVAAAETEA